MDAAKLISEGLVLLIYFFVVKLQSSKIASAQKSFIAILISYIFFYDFLNYQIPQALGFEIILFKLGLEFFSATSLILFLIRQKAEKQQIKLFLLFLVVLLCSLSVGIANGISIRLIYGDIRSMILPILLVMSLTLSQAIEQVTVKFLVNVLSILLLINGLYATYEFFNYNGNFQDYWRYKSLLQSNTGINVDFNENQLFYQLERSGNLRSSGFFVSALASAFTYGFVTIYFIISSRDTSNIISKLKYYLLSALFLSFSYITQVRTSFLMAAIGLLTVITLDLIKSQKIKKTMVYIIPIVIMGLLYFYLTSSFGLFKDASSQGRIVQYSVLFSKFQIMGNGLGSFPRTFDSYYIYSILELGVFSFLLFYILYKMLTSQTHNRVSNRHVYVQFATFLFICSFQHLSGSLYYFLVILVISKNDFTKTSFKRRPKVYQLEVQ